MLTAKQRFRNIGAKSTRILQEFWTGGTRSTPAIEPAHCDLPVLRDAEIAALYYGQRMAGDFYEFIRVSSDRVIFTLLDVAGRRADTRNVLVAAQNTFRNSASSLFEPQNINEAEAMSELCQEMNRTILRCGPGVRSCPGFTACYNESLGTICYGNAGHTPGLLIDTSGISKLEATGLPLGLFSHTVHGSYTCALVPGAMLLIMSRGLMEIMGNGEELAMEAALRVLPYGIPIAASHLCTTILRSAQALVGESPIDNDLTVLALIRRREDRL